MEGPPQIINAGGVVARPATSNTASLITQFDRAARAAFPSPQRDNTSGEIRSVPLTADQPAVDEFLNSGLTLVYANCNDYFWVMGQYQTGTRVGRDLIAPVVTVLTGLVTAGVLEDWGSDENLLTGLTLGSSLATSGLDVYEAHFLFGAESVDSVRELTFNALAEHRDKVKGLPITTPYQAAMHLIDHQSICTPAHILRLVREAIAEGRVQGTVTGGTAAREDLDWRSSLGQAVGIEGPLTTAQAYALWRLFETPDPKLQRIYEALAGLPSNPVTKDETKDPPTYAMTANWTPRPRILVRLASIPSTTRETYARQRLAETERDLQNAQRARISQAELPELLPPVVTGGAGGYQRVRVGIVNGPE